MVDAALSLLVAHQDSRYREWGFTGSVRFDPRPVGPRPYAGLVSSAMGYRALRPALRRGGSRARGRTASAACWTTSATGGADLGRRGDAAHSVQVRGGVTF